jgi:hypothetical protein
MYNVCKTVEFISLYGDKRLKKVCSKPVRYSSATYKKACELASIDEAIYYAEMEGVSVITMMKLNRKWHKKCREVERAIKETTRRYKKYVKMGALRAREEADCGDK